MAFSEFKTVSEVKIRFNLDTDKKKFLEKIAIEPDSLIGGLLQIGKKFSHEERGETFEKEAFIGPLLLIIASRFNRINVWINEYTLYGDDGLNGTPDYVLSSVNKLDDYRKTDAPLLLAVTEAKKQDFEAGWAQALAQMLACQKQNKANKSKAADFTIYAIVTTGDFWQFGKLDENKFTLNETKYSIDFPEYLLGALQQVFESCEANAEAYVKNLENIKK